MGLLSVHLLAISLPECITRESREFIDFVLKTVSILKEFTFCNGELIKKKEGKSREKEGRGWVRECCTGEGSVCSFRG